MAMLAILILPLSILGFTALATVLPAGLAGLGQCRPARLQRDPLRLHLGHRQQRQRLRRPHRQHALLQHHAGPRDDDRPLPDDRADAGGRRLAGRQEARAGLGRHLPDRQRPLFVGLLVGVILIVGGLTYFPAAVARPRRRAFRDARRHALLRTDHEHRRQPPQTLRWASSQPQAQPSPRCCSTILIVRRSATPSASSIRAP